MRPRLSEPKRCLRLIPRKAAYVVACLGFAAIISGSASVVNASTVSDVSPTNVPATPPRFSFSSLDLTQRAKPTTRRDHDQEQNDNVYVGWNELSPGDVDFAQQTLTPTSFEPTNYYALNWFFNDQTYGGYTGLQTDDNGNPTIAIFSIWGGTAGIPGSGGVCQNFVENGAGIQCLLPFTYDATSTYQFTVRYIGDGLWTAVITDLNTGGATVIGDITLPLDVTGMTHFSNFIEYWGIPFACNQSPVTAATWSAPVTSVSGNSTYSVPASYDDSVYGGDPCSTSDVVVTGSGNDVSAHVTLGTAPQVIPPPTVPLSPTATASSTSVTVKWDASTGFDGATTNYRVTSQPGGLTCTTTRPSCSVANLRHATTYAFTVVASNIGGSSTVSAPSNSVRLRSVPALRVSTTRLATAHPHVEYRDVILAKGGTGSLTWRLESGGLPRGLRLSSTGVISGVPLDSLTSNFEVTVTDHEGQRSSRWLTLLVND